MGVPAVYICTQAILSLYSSGSLTGVVIDSGYATTCVTPIYKGYEISHALEHVNLAGRDVTRSLLLSLKNKSKGDITNYEINEKVARAIKEADGMLYVAINYE